MSLEQFIGDWGLPAVFLGGLAEGETAGFAGGLLAHRGFFSLPMAALAVGGGAFIADQVGFHLGRWMSETALVRRMLARAPAQRLAERVAAHPARWALLMRWLYGLRSVVALSLGALGVSPLLFLWLDALSAAVWSLTVTGLGYGLSHGLMALFGPAPLHHHLLIVLGLGAVVAALIWHFSRRLLRRD